MNTSLGLSRANDRLQTGDYCFLLMSVATIAFHDVKPLLIMSQLLFIASQYLSIIKQGRMRVNRILKYYILWGSVFSAYALLSYIWAVDRRTLISCVISIVQVVLLGSGVIIYTSSIEKYERAVNLLTIGALTLCVRMVIFIPISVWGTERVGWYIGYGNVSITYSLSYIAIFAFYEGMRRKKALLTLASIVIVVFSCLSGSKKAVFIAAASIGGILVLRSKSPIKTFRNIAIAIVALVIAYYALFNIDLLYDSVGRRIDSMFGYLQGTVLDKSTRDRLLLTQYAKEVFFQYPILGVGLDAFRYINPLGLYAHNNFLELLSCLGIVGFSLYYSFVISLFLKGINKAVFRKRIEFYIVVIVLACLLFMDIASVSYSLEPIQITIALCYSYYHIIERENAKNEN